MTIRLYGRNARISAAAAGVRVMIPTPTTNQIVQLLYVHSEQRSY